MKTGNVTIFLHVSRFVLRLAPVISTPYETERFMQTLDNPKIIMIADRAHELQREARDLSNKLKEIGDELEPLRTSLFRASAGQDFQYVSADGYIKAVEFNMDESEMDVEAMVTRLKGLKYKIPFKQRVAAVVRWLRADEE